MGFNLIHESVKGVRIIWCSFSAQGNP